MVRAAARLFSARGYHGTSMQDLGEALGLRRGSLYAHIGSKEELLFDVVSEGARRFLEKGAEAGALGAPAATRLRALLAGHIETAIEHLEAATVFLNEWQYLSEDLRSLIKGQRDEYEAIVRGIVEDGISSGEFRADVDVNLAAKLVLSGGNWVYAWYRPGGALSPGDIGDRYADLLVRGLSSRTGVTSNEELPEPSSVEVGS